MDKFHINESDLVLKQRIGRAYSDVWKAKWRGKGAKAIVAVKKISMEFHPQLKLNDEVGILFSYSTIFFY